MFNYLVLLITLKFSLGDNSLPELDVGPRIVSGSPITIEEFPWQVSIMKDGDSKCGGTLVHPKYVLTASHCIIDWKASDLSVRAGSAVRNQGGTVIKVRKIYIHPYFNRYTYDYDVCVLRLLTMFKLGPTIQLKSLPPQDAEVHPGWKCNATGWGRLYLNGPYPDQLQKVVMPILHRHNECETAYPGEITENMFCAGYMEGGKDTCEGDSGGPLTFNDYVVGITSWGIGCAEPNKPGVFTKVSRFTDFISDLINQVFPQ